MQKLQYQSTAEQTQRFSNNKFGKLIIIINTKYIKITLGPDYKFFIPAFLFFLIAGMFIIVIVNKNIQNSVLHWITNFVCIFQPSAYLYTALSNPGIVYESLVNLSTQTITTPESINKQYKLCKKCNIYTQKSTYHCRQCDVCIQEYDHHCPWVSKCIGKNNLKAFYVFIISTPIFIIYSIVMFFICASISIINNSTNK